VNRESAHVKREFARVKREFARVKREFARVKRESACVKREFARVNTQVHARERQASRVKRKQVSSGGAIAYSVTRAPEPVIIQGRSEANCTNRQDLRTVRGFSLIEHVGPGGVIKR
jgi:septal ring factor EnvC (AmiA/AmiB activator)